MLAHLSIENYALIDRLEVDLDSRLNVITGETGSGKSILLGALSLILGGKSDVEALRDKSRNCVVEGEFDLSRYGVQGLFSQLDIEYQPQTTIRRVVMPSGKSRAYINDLPIQLALLKSIAARFIDVHSQHQTMLIGQSRFQVEVVDGVCSHSKLLGEYGICYGELKAAERELSEAKQSVEQNRKDREYIEFQLSKFLEAKIYDGEQQELEARQNELLHASQIKESMFSGSEMIGGRDSNIIAQIKDILNSLGSVSEVYAPASEMVERLDSINVELKDIYNEMEALGSQVEDNPKLLEHTQERLDTIYMLQSRHGVESIAELIAIRDELQSKLELIDGSQEHIEQLEANILKLKEGATALSSKISANRAKAAPKIESYISKTLAQLGMPDAVLKVEITPIEMQADGADQIRFMFTANKGGVAQPIERVASGGEMSRLMLSIKALSAKNSDLPTIIFDEIDTGVSGNIANKMGEMIVELSSNIQIINITHLPQVASKGETHFVVSKNVEGSSTKSTITKLSPEQRVDEVAKMLSGSDITPAARAQAEHLLGLK